MSILAIASGKGGTGVTTLAISLGASFVEHGLDTTLIDAHMSLPNVGIHLGTPNVPVGLQDALDDPTKLNDAVYHHAPSGLKVIPGLLALKHATQGKQRDLLKIPSLVASLSPQIVLDCASGISQETLAALAIADEVVVVTTPELPAIIDALKLIKRCQALKTPVKGVIINRIGQHSHEIAASNIQALLEVPVLASIPNDAHVSEAQAVRHPFTYSHPDCKASQAMKKLAALWIN
ncbi:MAG: P-loop NTPase [Nanoarchaeota archaeon]